MKAIKNLNDFTIQFNFQGKTIEIPAGGVIDTQFFSFNEEEAEESLKYFYLKLKRKGYKVELVNFGEEIDCPCCGAKISLTKKKEEVPIKKKRGRKKKEI